MEVSNALVIEVIEGKQNGQRYEVCGELTSRTFWFVKSPHFIEELEQENANRSPVTINGFKSR